MRRTVALLSLILAGSRLATAQNRNASTDEKAQAVVFCELFDRPDRFNDKTVKVSATYVVGFHEAIFVDEACKESPDGPHLEARARFAGVDEGTAQAFKALTDFLKKYKTSRAEVTVIAVFHDDSALGVVHAGTSPGFSLDVKQLLSVEKVKSHNENSEKN